MDYIDIMSQSAGIYNDRHNQYGDMRDMLEHQAKLATLVLSKPITAYDIAMISHVMKLGRLKNDRPNLDSYVDGINYLAFAGVIAASKTIEDEIAEMARKFAPESSTSEGEI